MFHNYVTRESSSSLLDLTIMVGVCEPSHNGGKGCFQMYTSLSQEDHTGVHITMAFDLCVPTSNVPVP